MKFIKTEFEDINRLKADLDVLKRLKDERE
jgi:hypothetical protein